MPPLEPESLSPYQPVPTTDGGLTLSDTRNGQAMHSRLGAWPEAMELYVLQSGLAEKLRTLSPTSPLVLYDVGMGIAANALAAVEAALQTPGGARPLHLISFENDLVGLRTAIQLHHEARSNFTFFEGRAGILQDILNHRRWRDPAARVHWEILEGDFAETLSAIKPPPPELVYFDFYDPKTCPNLWGIRIFRALRAAIGDRDCELLTYSSSTAVRSALLLSGFCVGNGCGTSSKKESTQAATRLSALRDPLRSDWLGKLGRSNRPLPIDWREETGLISPGEALERIRSLPQFAQPATVFSSI